MGDGWEGSREASLACTDKRKERESVRPLCDKREGISYSFFTLFVGLLLGWGVGWLVGWLVGCEGKTEGGG